MSSKAMSLKAKIRNIAKSKNVAAQVILQNYMFERLLERISVSEYKNNFILKGGILVSAMVGLDTRSTMDLDTTIKSYPLNEESITTILLKICNINLDDGTIFRFVGIELIRKDDEYGGFRVSLESVYDTIVTPLSIDISTGDVITPKEILYSFKTIFDDGKKIELWAYNTETILAEKMETILRRGVFNTRPRDFYDIFILSKTQKFDINVFKSALTATAKHRETDQQISNVSIIIENIRNNGNLKSMWTKYQREYIYARDISFEDILTVIKDLMD